MRTFKGFVFGLGFVALFVLSDEVIPAGSPVDHVRPWLLVAGVVVLAFTVNESVINRTVWRVFLVGATAAGLGVWFAGLPVEVPGQSFWLWPAVLGGVLLVGALVSLSQGRGGSAGLVHRWLRRSRRSEGVAGWWAIRRTSSVIAARKKLGVLRPSLAGLGWWARRQVPGREYATPLARVGWRRVWSPIEDVTLRVGGPRTGKTGELAGRILDAPGAVIATSTRTDLVELTGPLRRERGPVHVFNPSGLGGLASTITFDPLSGCGDPAVATTRATDLLGGVTAPGGSGGDREFWASQARRVLAALMHAAALGNASMRDVLAWVADPEEASADVQRYLRRSPEPAFESDALQFLETNDRTRSSICATIMPALGWLTDATAAKAAESGGFYVNELLDTRGTVYMLGAEDAQVAPLVTALTGHIAREARRIAGTMPGGRLDPPLTLALDEAALICPVPLDNWTADMGGRNVTIHIAAQSRAQLRQRWGDTGAAAIMNNAATLMIFGGTRDPEDLQAYSTLTGERDEEVRTFDADRQVASYTTRRVPVLAPAQIAQLPARKVVIIRRGMAPAVGTARMAWKRFDVRWHRLTTAWNTRLDWWGAWWETTAVRVDALYRAAADALQAVTARFGRRTAERQAEPTRQLEPATTPAAWSDESGVDSTVNGSVVDGGEPR